jgi:excisionase family DNA binding protein
MMKEGKKIEPENLASIDEAAQAAGVSRRTIYLWIKKDKLKYVRTAGGAVRIFRDSLFRSGNVPLKAERRT